MTIETLRGLVEQATKGPLSIRYEFNIFANGRLFANAGGYSNNWESEKIERENLANTKLIVAAVNALPALLAVAEAARRQHENIVRWQETGEPAGPEESKSIAEQIRSALARLDGEVGHE